MSAALEEVARRALIDQRETEALAQLLPAAVAGESPRLWQWTALLHRALEQHPAALIAFARAAAAAPDDPGIAHGHARVALEAGIASVALFERARRLAPTDGGVLLGLGSARLAAGEGEVALADLTAILDANPCWIDGHRQFAQVAALLGRPDRARDSFDRAIARGEQALVPARLDYLIQARRFAELGALAADDRSAALYRVIAAAETFDRAAADRGFAALGPVPELRIWRVRYLIRTGRIADALPVIDQWLASGDAVSAWPYAAIAWRLTDDPRLAWLDRADFVSVVDLGDLPAGLGDTLRALHARSGQYDDQSVSGGSQTDGPLFARINPAIVALRAIISDAVTAYVAALPAPDPAHPLLRHRRDRLPRFAGSWSVRLGAAGHHRAHVHPLGWISSALYVAVPPATERGAQAYAGWLALGEPEEGLATGIEPTQMVEPRPGRLVLFPSTMWHGTRPFAVGERMSVAFDVAPPR